MPNSQKETNIYYDILHKKKKKNDENMHIEANVQKSVSFNLIVTNIEMLKMRSWNEKVEWKMACKHSVHDSVLGWKNWNVIIYQNQTSQSCKIKPTK